MPFKDPAMQRASAERWRLKNRPRKNNPLKYGITYKGNEPEYRRLESLVRRVEDPIRYLLNQARYRAKKRGLEFEIVQEELEIPSHCPVFGIPLFFKAGRRGPNSFSIDRIDNSKGYTKGNVRIISFKANQYKGNMTIEEVENLLAYMKGQ